jgi:pSer/pThr/pTyr-binding forkhead associated (FHA) protein
MTDANRTQMIADDPNRTMLGAAPTLNATQTIKPVQCPVCKSHNPPGVMFCIECGLIFDRTLPDDAFGAPIVRLPVLVESGGREHPIRPGENLVGREGDVMLSDPKVSRRHARILCEDGSMSVEDLGSTNGSELNGAVLEPGRPMPMKAGDRVRFGGVELTLSMPGATGATEIAGAPPSASEAPVLEVKEEVQPHLAPAAYLVVGDREIPLRQGANFFGRKPDNDAQIPDPYVSGRHGRIDVEDGFVFVTDLGSTNGTLLNGEKLEPNEKTKLEEADELVIGALTLRIRKRAG